MTEFAKFDDDRKEEYTILVPSMLPIHFQLFVPIFEKFGYHIVVLENDGDTIKEEGLMHVHNDTCYPALLVIGQFMEALKSGAYDLDHVALAITQTAGGCRASNYLSLLRKALLMEHLENVPCISVNFAGLEKDNGIQLTIPLIKCLLYGVLYGDALMWLYNQVRPYEKYAGNTDQVLQDLVEDLKRDFIEDSFTDSKRIYKYMVSRFKNVSRINEKKIKIGIVGEIYMKYSPLGNHDLVNYLIQEGFEPVLTGAMDFGLYCLENGLVDHAYYHRHPLTHSAYKLAKEVVMKMQKEFSSIVVKDATFVAPDAFDDVIMNGKEVIDPGIKMGEGWLLTSEVASLIQMGVTNIISAQPFGCLPNHIVAKGMIHRIKERYPKANIVAIDYDPSASKVNQENRIRLMLANAKLSSEWKEG